MLRRDISKMLFASAAGSAVLTQSAKAQACALPCYPRTATEIAAGVIPTNYEYTASPLDIRRLGAVGNDSTDNVTAFANARAIAAASSTPVEIVFPEGIYRISASQNWFVDGITLQALGKVVIKSTASSGFIMVFDAGASTNGYRCRMLGDFILDSTGAGVGTGLYTRNVNHCVFECRVRNVVSAACVVEGAVLSSYKIVCTSVANPMSITPVNGITIDGTAANSATTDCTFDLLIEAATDSGVVLIKANNNIFRGTSEGVGGKGLQINSTCTGNLFHAFFMEANYSAGDLDCYGSGNRFVNCVASSKSLSPPYESVKSIVIRNGAERNVWEGGAFYAAQVETGGLNNVFTNFDSGYQVLDGGTHSTIFGRQSNLSTGIRAAKIQIQEDWTNLTTINSWTNTSGTYQQAQYTINRSTNEILVRGEVGGGTAGSVIAVLPVGYRPAKQFTFVCPSTTTQNYATVSVATNGNVKHVAGYATSIDLGQVRFFI